MSLKIKPATSQDAVIVASILHEAAEWLNSSGRLLWEANHIALDYVESEIQAGRFFIALVDGVDAGVVRFDLEDAEFWPEITDASSTFIHRLAVRRQFSGGCISSALLRFAAYYAASFQRRFLRLDCAYDRPKLRAVYERFGFTFHSIFDAGSFRVARYELLLADLADPCDSIT